MTVTKHDWTPSNEMVPCDAVQPRLHPTTEIISAIGGDNLRADAILQSLAYLAVEGDWRALWRLADALKREVSILFDAQGLVWVDIGDPGMVHLAPPIGCCLPLRLWVHTHPVDAYWSATDQRTLATVAGILDRALVLGDDHLVWARHRAEPSTGSDDVRISEEGPLSQWTAESAVLYA
jgi:hypothetical protein